MPSRLKPLGFGSQLKNLSELKVVVGLAWTQRKGGAGRSFSFKPLASTGDREAGQLIGEYTIEFRNESAHGVLSGFTA